MKLGKIVIFVLIVIILGQSAFALQIVSPKEGEVFSAGSTITLIIKPDPGEEWENIIYGLRTLSYNPLSNEYRTTLRIPADVVGNEKLSVIGLDKSGNETEVIRNIIVKLPLNVFLQSIIVGEDYMLLYRLPAEATNPTDYEKYFESRQISVSGLYSDGVAREASASASGTTYASSNEKVVTVSPEGKATAQGLGSAKITIRNGKFSTRVDIEVLPYRQPQK